VSGSRGFGVAAGLDAEVATPLAARCAELGYGSMWSNDHPAASGLETLADFAAGSDDVELGVGVLALDRNEPGEINAAIDSLGLDRDRLLIGVGAGSRRSR
jgi:alkanesulfonate monooxygenase SsuD/methylene tetrahydromethanopterin reductase-like flavin-dependent oxidoreductase (luciferase family)